MMANDRLNRGFPEKMENFKSDGKFKPNLFLLSFFGNIQTRKSPGMPSTQEFLSVGVMHGANARKGSVAAILQKTLDNQASKLCGKTFGGRKNVRRGQRIAGKNKTGQPTLCLKRAGFRPDSIHP